jgi:hypothetical protein
MKTMDDKVYLVMLLLKGVDDTDNIEIESVHSNFASAKIRQDQLTGKHKRSYVLSYKVENLFVNESKQVEDQILD